MRNYRNNFIPNSLQILFASIRFAYSLIKSFKKPWTPRRSASFMKHGVVNRDTNFLDLCDSQIFENKQSPYQKLFDCTGYTKEKLTALVKNKGLEAALLQLAADGIYLDIDEFKGKKPVIRPGLQMTIDASAFDIIKGPGVTLKSSGSRGPGMRTRIGIPGLRLVASNLLLILTFLKSEHLPIVLYYPMPSVSGIIHLIVFTMAGKPPAAWFSQIPLTSLWLSKTGLKLLFLKAGARLTGISLPSPEFADINRPVNMALWLKKKCPKGATIPTFTGSALHLVQTAETAGIKLPPLTFFLGGEPITEKKRRIIEASGHHVFPWYSSVETGRIAIGCLSASNADDMHLLNDRIAAVIHPRRVDATDSLRSSLLLSSIHPDMYKFFLNVETGDEAVLDNRSCGCPWEAIGLNQHLSSVQSFEKLTLEGMSIVADNLFQFVEEELPARCGGTSVNYQFTEEEDTKGMTRLVLSASPAIPMETDRIQDVLMELFYGLQSTAFAARYLAQADAITVRREHPVLTRSGKILALRSIKKSVAP
jgi:hypothetical protein